MPQTSPWKSRASPTSQTLSVFTPTDNLEEMQGKLRDAEQMYWEAMRALETSSRVAHRQQREIEEAQEENEALLLDDYDREDDEEKPPPLPFKAVTQVAHIHYDENMADDRYGFDIQLIKVGLGWRALLRSRAVKDMSFFLAHPDGTIEATKKAVLDFLNGHILPTEEMTLRLARDLIDYNRPENLAQRLEGDL